MEVLKGLENTSDVDSDVGDTHSSRSDSPLLSYEVPNVFESSEVDENYQKVAETIIHHSKEAAKGKEISAPYEVPHFPIERDESRRAIQRQLSSRAQKELQEKRSYVFNLSPNDAVYHHAPQFADLFVPHFQRVSIGGEHCSGVPLEDLQQASSLLLQALKLREKYMNFSGQTFPAITARFLKPRSEHWLTNGAGIPIDENEGVKKLGHWGQKPSEHYSVERPTVKEPWSTPFIEDWDCSFLVENGVFQVYDNSKGKESPRRFEYAFPPLSEFVTDMTLMCAMIADGPLKSFCYRRLTYLSSKYQLHVLLNELRELGAQKAVPHRDFYNTRKVDTHVHASSCMNQKHLLRFIKKSMKNHSDDIVRVSNGKPMTLKQVFEALKVTTYDLSVDMLDVHADRNTFHRFDKFNAK